MATSTVSMDSIEQRRLQLEENVAMLSKTLEHWSAWEVEYEMLKEELQKADSPSPAAMIEIGRELGGTLVNEKEVLELLGKDVNSTRTANVVVDMITRRIDYVTQNRSTVEKQLEKAEKQLAGVSILADPGLETEEGLPMMDIEEKLDEDENVISSSVTQPGKVAPELLEALRKAGIHKSELSNSQTGEAAAGEPSTISAPASTSTTIPASSFSKPTTAMKSPETVKKSPLAKATSETKANVSGAPPKKKSVAFAEDVQVKTFEKPSSAKDELRAWNLKPGSRVYELGEDEEVHATHVVPVADSAEEAQLRRDMVEFGLSEVGAVVAELDIDDADGFDDDDDEDEDDSDEDEDEDEHGRSTRPYLSEDYRQQMADLEKKLNARMVENVGPRPDLHPLASVADDVRSLVIRQDDEFDSSMGMGSSDAVNAEENAEAKKKGVRFADAPESSQATETWTEPSAPPAPTISDTIVERTATAPTPPTAPSKPAKVSRFKSARASTQPSQLMSTPPVAEPLPMPTGPKDRTLASTVIEHRPQSSEPQEPDEFDPLLLNREINTEYHKMRNKMIQQQGGYKESEEEKNNPLMEERDGQPRKVSRFMAAKLRVAEGL
jgi:unconventional prefoldin RPB5 interactor 1